MTRIVQFCVGAIIMFTGIIIGAFIRGFNDHSRW